MNNQEMIQKFGLKVGFGLLPGSEKPQKGLIVKIGKPSADEFDYIKSHKIEIITEIEAEETKKEAEKKEAKEAEIAAIKSGETKIKVYYHDGEYLSAWEVMEDAAELLEEIGVAKYIDGWGFRVDEKFIEIVGEEFTYLQAVEFAKPQIESIAAKKAENEAEIKAKFEEAKQSGKPVEIARWMEDCNDCHEECSTDIISKYAMPDGTTKVKRIHTW